MPRTAFRRVVSVLVAPGCCTSGCGSEEPEALEPMEPEVPRTCARRCSEAREGRVWTRTARHGQPDRRLLAASPTTRRARCAQS